MHPKDKAGAEEPLISWVQLEAQPTDGILSMTSSNNMWVVSTTCELLQVFAFWVAVDAATNILAFVFFGTWAYIIYT